MQLEGLPHAARIHFEVNSQMHAVQGPAMLETREEGDDSSGPTGPPGAFQKRCNIADPDEPQPRQPSPSCLRRKDADASDARVRIQREVHPFDLSARGGIRFPAGGGVDRVERHPEIPEPPAGGVAGECGSNGVQGYLRVPAAVGFRRVEAVFEQHPVPRHAPKRRVLRPGLLQQGGDARC